MFSLKRLSQSRAARNAAASYFAFFSVSLSTFVSIPVVVHFLDKEQIGLWTVVNQVVGYLLWMDLGVASAAGRKLADAIVTNDQEEINRWWTAIFGILCLLGLLMIMIGLAFGPLMVSFLNIPQVYQADAWYLFLGSLFLSGINFPIKSAPGFLTAQERFHWCPIAQSITPWISIAFFYTALSHGFGVRSYVWSLAASQAFTWIYYLILLRNGPQTPAFDRNGLTRTRFKSLFGYSMNICLLSLVESVLASLPAMILARAGGLAQIPVYAFSSRGPAMISSLVRRTTHAFYPRLQSLYVSGQKEAFREKYRQVGLLTLSVGLIASGIALTGNQTFVSFLAGPDFFSGNWSNMWFTLGVIAVPGFALFEILLPLSGSLGKTALFAPLKAVIGLAASYFLFKAFGLPGLAATFAFLPLIYGLYAYRRGAQNCGIRPSALGGRILTVVSGGLALVLVGGTLIACFPSTGPSFDAFGRKVQLPGPVECSVGLCLVLAGGMLAMRQMRLLAK